MRWMCFSALMLLALPVAATDANAYGYLDDVRADASTCTAASGDPVGCYTKASPERCKAAAVNMVANPPLFRRTWGICVLSCGKASWWDRHVGDCRK